MAEDPEDALKYFKVKRSQFNHRLPTLLTDLFEEFDNEKKYLLEYMVWIACKYFGHKLSDAKLGKGTDYKKFQIDMIENYMSIVKSLLIKKLNLSALDKIEKSVEDIMKEELLERARLEAEKSNLNQDS